MTKLEFVELNRHELGGMILDAMKPRDGAHAAMFARQILSKVDRRLEEIYRQLCPGEPVKTKEQRATVPIR